MTRFYRVTGVKLRVGVISVITIVSFIMVSCLCVMPLTQPTLGDLMRIIHHEVHGSNAGNSGETQTNILADGNGKSSLQSLLLTP